MHIATSRWHTTVAGLLPGIAWGLLVLVLTLVMLVLGAIVLPAQAQGTSTRRTLIAGTQVHPAGRRPVAAWIVPTGAKTGNIGTTTKGGKISSKT